MQDACILGLDLLAASRAMLNLRKEMLAMKMGQVKLLPAASGGSVRGKGSVHKQHPHQHRRCSGQVRKWKAAKRSAAADVIAPSSTGLDPVSCEDFYCAQEVDAEFWARTWLQVGQKLGWADTTQASH